MLIAIFATEYIISSMQTRDMTVHSNPDIYVRDKIWYVWLCEKTNMVVHSVGSMFPITNMEIQQNRGMVVHEIGKINEPTWRILKKCSSSTYYIGFIDIKNEEIKYYKFKAFPVNDTLVDSKSHYSPINMISLQVKLLDEHGQLSDRASKVVVKKITGRVNRSIGDYNFVDSTGEIITTGKTMDINNGDIFHVKVNSTGQYSMKITADFNEDGESIASLHRFAMIHHNEHVI